MNANQSMPVALNTNFTSGWRSPTPEKRKRQTIMPLLEGRRTTSNALATAGSKPS